MKNIFLISSFIILLSSQINFAREFEFTEGDFEAPIAYPLITKNLYAKSFTVKALDDYMQEKIAKEIPGNICILGSDELSLTWLKDPLTQMHLKNFTYEGYCMAVNLASSDELKMLQDRFKALGIKIPVIPMNANNFAAFYEIHEYPGILNPEIGTYLQKAP